MYKVDYERTKSEFLKQTVFDSRIQFGTFFHTNVYLLLHEICTTLLSNETHETQFNSASFFRNAPNSYFVFAYLCPINKFSLKVELTYK